MADRYPQHRPLLPGEIAILDPQAGVVRPESAVMAAACRARQLGATILDHTQVTAVELGADGVRVHTGDREYRVRHAVLAAGPWTSRFAPALTKCITPRRVVMTWYLAEDPAAYAPERFPVSIRTSQGTHISAFPSLDSRSVKIAVSASFSDLPDADHLDRTVPPQVVDVVDDAVTRFMPGLIPGPVRVSAYMDGYTLDGHALVGPVPGVPNLWLLGGSPGTGSSSHPPSGRSSPI